MQLMQSHMAAKRAQGRRGGGGSSDFASRSAVAPVVDLHRRGAGGGGGGTNAEGSYRLVVRIPLSISLDGQCVFLAPIGTHFALQVIPFCGTSSSSSTLSNFCLFNLRSVSG